MPFAFVLPNPRSSPYNLFEFCHRLDFLVYDNETAGLAVNSGGQHFRSGNNGRVGLVNIDEVIKLLLAFVIISGNFHYISVVFLAEVGIVYSEKLSHCFRFLNIRAEDYRLGHSPDLLQHLCDASCDNVASLFNCESSSEVFSVKKSRLHQQSVIVRISFLGHIPGEVNTDE